MTGWTLETLKEHFQAMMTEADRRNQQRFDAQKEAIAKAEAAAEKRFESVNEFRQQLNDQAASFMPRREAEQRLKVLEADLHRQGGKEDGTGRFGAVLISVASLIIAAIAVTVTVFK